MKGLVFLGAMGHLSSMFNGLARSFSIKRKKHNSSGSESISTNARDSVEELVKEAKKNDLILRSSGFVNFEGSNNLASVYMKRGQKGTNQDCCIVWEGFGYQQDMIFCGIFDGHGPWGHFVAKRVRELLPSSLLHTWRESVAQASSDLDNMDLEDEADKKLQWFNIWKHSYLKTCAAVDQDLEHHRKLDAFYSGTTALSIVRQGERIIIANVGDSRAVLATTSDNGSLEASNGRVYCLGDEPGVHRVWLPDEDSPGLAMSRAFGDYCVKDFGLISVPDVTQMNISTKDQFLVLATDGVWDVVSNQEAVEIIASAPDKEKAAKWLVKHAMKAWKRKKRGIAMDDISAICLFFHSCSSSSSSSGFPSQVDGDIHVLTS
ncbi:hypothetical protein V2J09_007855 [Rumex salicifolius]